MSRLAIIAGAGDLPAELLTSAEGAVAVTVGAPPEGLPAADPIVAEVERLGDLFAALRARDVARVCFAGAMARPALDPARFDDVMREFAPRLMPALAQGDDALLREVIGLFEAQGFEVVSPAEIAPHLLCAEGEMLGRDMSEAEARDAARGHEILHHLGPLDIGQGCVVAAGLCLGIETLQGTDAMLAFVGATPPELRRAPGVMVKGPKPGQDMRVDMPVIGPQTIRNAAAAGLAGIVIPAAGVLVLDRDGVEQELAASGLFLAAL